MIYWFGFVYTVGKEESDQRGSWMGLYSLKRVIDHTNIRHHVEHVKTQICK